MAKNTLRYFHIKEPDHVTAARNTRVDIFHLTDIFSDSRPLQAVKFLILSRIVLLSSGIFADLPALF